MSKSKIFLRIPLKSVSGVRLRVEGNEGKSWFLLKIMLWKCYLQQESSRAHSGYPNIHIILAFDAQNMFWNKVSFRVHVRFSRWLHEKWCTVFPYCFLCIWRPDFPESAQLEQTCTRNETSFQNILCTSNASLIRIFGYPACAGDVLMSKSVFGEIIFCVFIIFPMLSSVTLKTQISFWNRISI